MAFNKNAEDTLLLSLWPIKGCINGKNHGNQNSLDLSFCVSMFSPSLYKGRRNYFPIKKGWDLEFHRIPSFKVSESCFWILSGHERLGTVQVCGVGRVAGWLFLIFLTTMVAHCSLQFLVAVWFLREDKQDLIGRGDYMLQIGGDETWCSKCWLFWLISPFKNCPLVFLGRLISYFMTPDFFSKIRRFVFRTLPPKKWSTSSQDEHFRVKFGILPNVSLIFFWMILGQAWCKLAATGAHGNASKNSLWCKAYGERRGLDGWIRIQLECFSVAIFCFLFLFVCIQIFGLLIP